MSGRQTDMGFPDESPAKAAMSVKPRNTRRMAVRGIEVTQSDIDHAVRENSHYCMIAEAIKRQVPGVERVSVDIQTIRFTDTKGNRRVACLTPPLAQRGLMTFDLGLPVEPFKFNLQSVQVTAKQKFVAKLGADGEPLRRERVRRTTRADGTVVERTVVESVKRQVQQATTVKEFSNSAARGEPFRDHIVGGKLPPVHKASAVRRFGVKGFTWFNREPAEAVAERVLDPVPPVEPAAS